MAMSRKGGGFASCHSAWHEQASDVMHGMNMEGHRRQIRWIDTGINRQIRRERERGA